MKYLFGERSKDIGNGEVRSRLFQAIFRVQQLAVERVSRVILKVLMIKGFKEMKVDLSGIKVFERVPVNAVM